jgi:hypothetical protein
MIKRVIKRKKRKFPFIGSLLVLIGVVWILKDLGKISDFPWISAIFILFGIALIYNRL